MKRIIKKGSLLFLLALGFAASAQQKQSLKDLLYSGKLKADSNAVVRKDEDLSARIDTSTQKPVEAEKPKVAVTTATEPANAATNPQRTETTTTTTATANGTETPDNGAAAPTTPKAVVKSPTRIWKEYTDSLSKVLTAEVLTSKKIKKDTYFIMAEYEIGETGAVNILNVTSSPENPYLQSEVKSRMELGTPQMAPVVDSTGKARKVKRKVSFSLTKE